MKLPPQSIGRIVGLLSNGFRVVEFGSRIVYFSMDEVENVGWIALAPLEAGQRVALAKSCRFGTKGLPGVVHKILHGSRYPVRIDFGHEDVRCFGYLDEGEWFVRIQTDLPPGVNSLCPKIKG
jgi:hypothetical protein